MQPVPIALAFALPNAGRSMPAKIAMIAITTSNSMRVNAAERTRRDGDIPFRYAVNRSTASEEFHPENSSEDLP